MTKNNLPYATKLQKDVGRTLAELHTFQRVNVPQWDEEIYQLRQQISEREAADEQHKQQLLEEYSAQYQQDIAQLEANLPTMWLRLRKKPRMRYTMIFIR